MSADFWAGYISGAVGVLIGNPLDIVKVQLQSGLSASLVTQSRSLLLKHIDYVQLTRGRYHSR
jgi:solute carrier family 25 carnitine/acylcarnitine transporter 20/29